ncbi:MAG: ATP-binding protein [Candidatus Bipolaricaulota bacterium]
MDNKLTPQQLRRRSEPDSMAFSTTEELSPLEGIVGQDRALDALRVGLSIKDERSRYNIYVSGATGLGKTSAVSYFLHRVSREQETPPDICYVQNFQSPQEPRYLLVPAGRGKELRQDMERCVEFLRRELPKALESDEFKAQAKEERDRYTSQRDQLFQELEGKARELGFTVQRTPVGMNTIPLKPDGEPYSQEEYSALSEEEKSDILRRQEELQEVIGDTFRRLGQLEEGWQESRRKLTKRAAQFLVEPRFCQLSDKYSELERVREFLREVQADILEHVEELRPANKQPTGTPSVPQAQAQTQDRFQRYSVNVLVDRSEEEGAPVVVEENATYTNLVGTVERRVQFGVVTTDFSQIRPGSLHRANGGYLVVSAPNLLRSWMSWDALKTALRTGKVRIEDPAQMLGISSTEGLRPEPVPLDVKVIIIGSPWLYHLLHHYDEDFQKHFSIRADFSTETEWTQEAELTMARFVRSRQCEDRGVLPFAPSGVSRLVEHAGEVAADQRKLSVRFSQLAALVREASFWAADADASKVRAEHVRQAIEKRRTRHGLVAEKVREWIARGKLVVDVDGVQVGQVNGLSVLDMGDFAFGRPARITASAYAGKDGVVDIEREAKLGGRVHTKGVMILKGYLGARFGGSHPVSLSASLTFEQSYSEVEGDSASTAELYALLSALAEVPLQQGIAVTGSIDQKGRLQAIGGVNEKVLGHFLVCKELGLNGEQGVIVPRGNVDMLMLPEEVVDAVDEGKFHVWACSTAEEGLEILTGMQVGEPDQEGRYPEESVFGRVQRRLETIRQVLRESRKAAEEDDE